MESSPPYDLLDKSGRAYSAWCEEAIKQCLFLYLGLLPLKHALLLPIATNFSSCSIDVKRYIFTSIKYLRLLPLLSAELELRIVRFFSR